MKKKLINLVLAASFVVSIAIPVMANGNSPKVILDDRQVYFSDQQPVIGDEGRTLVPVRGIFEAMGAKVEWDDSTKTATINSKDNITRVIITNNNPVMTVYTFTSLMGANKNDTTLDVSPRIIGDRTMVPLRAISEALKADVQWDNDKYTVTIKTPNSNTSSGGNATTPVKDTRVSLSISSDKTSVKAGDEITITINATNLKSNDFGIRSVCAGVFYDATKFEYQDYTAIVNGVATSDIIGGTNPAYKNDSVKALYLTNTTPTTASQDGAVMTLKFKALTDDSSSFILSDRVATDRGNDTSLIVLKGKEQLTIEDSKDLLIDTTPLKIN